MKYLNEENINLLGINWKDLIDVITSATKLIITEDYSQPIKPYLKYGDKRNRIIAMPAYLGGEFDIAGIKWIASFPGNITKKKRRANSVSILNESDTGIPIAIINTSIISTIRTVAISGAIIKKFLDNSSPQKPINIGIIGFGPIGQYHLNMVESMFSNLISKITIFDINQEKQKSLPENIDTPIEWVTNWKSVYSVSDILITCTVSDLPYIDDAPPKGSLQLNVSLRDYKAKMMKYMDFIVVDNWEEVCRANTDIERMHLDHSLQKEDTYDIYEALFGDLFRNKQIGDVVMFNPMGMAIFDMAIANYYYLLSKKKEIGLNLS